MTIQEGMAKYVAIENAGPVDFRACVIPATSKEQALSLAASLNEKRSFFAEYISEKATEVYTRRVWCVVAVGDLCTHSEYNKDTRIHAVPSSPAPPATALFDGLTAIQCYTRFIKQQQGEGRKIGEVPLTKAQKDKASEMWSANLRAKVKDAHHKEVHRVLVDLEFEEWE